MHARRRLGRLAAIAAALATLTAACGGDDTPRTPGEEGATDVGGVVERGRTAVDEGEPVAGGRMIIGVNAETDGWEPNSFRWADAGHIVASSMFEPLATFDADGNLVPYLAESIESNDEGTVWTITLRTDASGKPFIPFHDGTILDAAALKANLDHALYAPLTGLAQRAYAPEVAIIDNATVQVTLSKPWRNWSVALTGPAGIMAAPSMITDPDGGDNPVGTGAYKFDEWIRDDRLTVTAFEDYWGDGPYLESITFRVLVDPISRSAAFDSGDVDMIVTTNPADVADYRERDDLQLIEDLRAEETFVMLNQAVPPFDNEHARRAIVLGTDQALINDVIGLDITIPAQGPFAPGDRYYSEDTGWPEHDPIAAKEAVEAYEAETGQPLTFSLTGVAESEVVKLNQQLVAMWGELGIQAEINTVEQTQYILDVATGKYEAAWFRNFGYTDPDFDYIFWHSSQSTPPPGISINFTHTEVPELDALLDHAREEAATEAERLADYEGVVQRLNEDMSYVWLFHTPAALIAQLDIRGLNPARERGGFGTFEPKPWLGQLWRAPA